MHRCGELCPPVAVEVEWGAVLIDPFMDDDIGHHHSLFGGHCSALSFSKLVLHHDDVLIPMVSSVYGSSIHRHLFVECAIYGPLQRPCSVHKSCIVYTTLQRPSVLSASRNISLSRQQSSLLIGEQPWRDDGKPWKSGT